MTTKVVNIVKQGVVTLLLIVGIIACEGDIKEVGVNIVDNELFKSDGYTSDVIAYNKNIDRRIANGLGQYLLGVYKNEEFGQLDGTIISQLIPSADVDFGVDPVIDTVIINIPYYSTYQGDYADGSPKYYLDSVIGLQYQTNILGDTIDVDANPFELKVFELETFLNTLDPTDPSQPLLYYTDDNYDHKTELFYKGDFIPNERDTVLYVDRPEIIEDPENDIYNVDTIKYIDSKPTLKLPLKSEYFTENFLNNPDIFESLEAFIDFFHGFYIEATPLAIPEASLMSLDLSNAVMTIYYTNTITSTDADGATVNTRTKQTANFQIAGVTNNKYTRNYAGSNAETVINNPDIVNGDEQLYVQGAAGSMALLELFVNDDLEELRSRNLLITNASLILYVDQSTDLSIAPYRMFAYNYETNEQLPDILFEGISNYGGTLERDSSGDPFSYKINITDYISRILAQEDPLEPSMLGLKVMNTSDVPENVADVDVEDYSWTPNGVVLHGNQAANVEKRPKLEISFSEINTN